MLDITEFLKYAAKEDASDVHLTVGAAPRMRIHGKLVAANFPKMTVSDNLDIFLRIVNPNQRDRFEVAGQIDLSVSIPGAGRYRVNAYKQRGSITMTFRLVDMEIPNPELLMIPESVLDICKKQRGLVIISGPSGSGKSTLTASLVDRINERRQANIITLEDPIEYLHTHKMSIVNQREIGFDTEDYMSGLRAALKEDADVISISNLPDADVAYQSFMAAQMGRLIFTSMYTLGIVETVEAVIGLFPEYKREMALNQLASCLRAVVTRQLLESVDGKSRIPAYGVMLVNNKIRSLIREGRIQDIVKVVEESTDKGMITMDQYLYKLYMQGQIDGSTAVAMSSDQERMEENILKYEVQKTSQSGGEL